MIGDLSLIEALTYEKKSLPMLHWKGVGAGQGGFLKTYKSSYAQVWVMAIRVPQRSSHKYIYSLKSTFIIELFLWILRRLD